MGCKKVPENKNLEKKVEQKIEKKPRLKNDKKKFEKKSARSNSLTKNNSDSIELTEKLAAVKNCQ